MKRNSIISLLLIHLVSFYIWYVILFSYRSGNFREMADFMVRYGFKEIALPLLLSLLPWVLAVFFDSHLRFTRSRKALDIIVYALVLPIIIASVLIN